MVKFNLIFLGVRRFGRLSSVKRMLAIETILILLLAWAFTRSVPTRFWSQFICTVEESTGNEEMPVKTRNGRDRNSYIFDHKPMARKKNVRLNNAGVISSEQDIARMIGRGVEKTVHYLPVRMRCLDKAIAAQWMLGRRGIKSVLRFGVRRDMLPDSGFEYHAWLMSGQEPVVGGNEVESYSAFPAFVFLRTGKIRN